MSVQSVALASLTATYTDSEGEDGFEEELQDNSKAASATLHNAHSRLASSPRPVHSVPTSPTTSSIGGSGSKVHSNNHTATVAAISTDTSNKLQGLVSYHDDTVISDEEGGLQVTLMDVVRPTENGTSAITTDTPVAPSRESPPSPPLVSDDDDADAYGVTIPPEPAGQCPSELQEKITKLHQKMQGGLDMNKVIQERKDFRNPSIYEKLIQFCGINELATNYPPDRFDPFKWGKDSFYEELAAVQKTEMDKLEKARKDKTAQSKCEIVTGTVKRSSSSNATEDEAKRRKSKWDQVASSNISAVKPTVLLTQPTLTTLTASATGTKATVISAFGSLPKKRL